MIAIFLICGCLFIPALSAVTYALVTNAYNEGYLAGVERGTYDACKQQVDTERLFRGIEPRNARFPYNNL